MTLSSTVVFQSEIVFLLNWIRYWT